MHDIRFPVVDWKDATIAGPATNTVANNLQLPLLQLLQTQLMTAKAAESLFHPSSYIRPALPVAWAVLKYFN